MAKLYINKEIVSEDRKFDHWWLTGADGQSFDDIRSFLQWMDPDDNRIDVEIHSCGGDTVEGFAIYDALRSAEGKEISCTVFGTCASMATVILLAAPVERRKAFPHARFLIHSPYYGRYDGAIDKETALSIANTLSAETEKMMAVYTERTGTDRETLEAQMKTDSWFNAEKAMELGFIGAIVSPVTASANLDGITNSHIDMAVKNVEVKESLLARLLAKCGLKSLDEVKALELTDANGVTITVEREDGEIQVGDKASPDGEFVLDDGRTIKIENGEITEIKQAEPTEDEPNVEELQQQIDDLQKQVDELKTQAKTESDNAILAEVAKLGGIEKIKTMASSYKVPSRTVEPAKQKGGESLLQAKLDEARKAYRERK